jgi:hypothetical protein
MLPLFPEQLQPLKELNIRTGSVLYLPLERDLRDHSIYNRAVTINNANMRVTNGAYFNGTNSYISFADSTDFTFGSENFSIMLDMFCNGMVYNSIIEKQGGNGVDWGCMHFYRDSNMKLTGFLNPQSNNNNNTFSIIGNTILYPNRWFNVGFHRNGTNVFLTVNNRIDASSTWTYGTWNDTYPLLIGASKLSGVVNNVFDGYIKNLVIFKGKCMYPAFK